MIRLLIYSALVLSVCACTTPIEINVFAKHLDKNQISIVSNEISSAGYQLSVNKLPFPNSITNNLLVYMPSDNSNIHVYNLLEMLENLDYKISSINLAKVGNHHFTADHIGIYLFPDGFKATHKSAYMGIVNNYGSVLCPNNLSLNEDKSFKIETETWNEIIEDYEIDITLGTWLEKEENIILLKSDNWLSNLIFKRTLMVEKAKSNNIQKISLIPQYNAEKSGPYLKSDAKLRNVNCTYELSIVI